MKTDRRSGAESRKLFGTVERLGLLKRLQRDFHALTGLTLDFVDSEAHPSRRLNAIQSFTPFCRFVRATPAGQAACAKCDYDAIQRLLQSPQARLYPCHLGLMEIAVPLALNGQMVGALTSGQFLLQPPNQKHFASIQDRLRRLGLAPRAAQHHYFSIPVLTISKAEAVTDLLALMAEHFLKLEKPIISLGHLQGVDQLYQAQQFIEKRYHEDIALADVAAAVHLSPSRLAHLFREKLHTSFVEYRNGLRIERAKFLLANTELRVLEVSLQTGFANLGNFNQQFQKHTGLSPRRYRAQHVTGSVQPKDGG